MCKPDKSFNTWVKSLFFVTWKCLAKSLIGPAACGRCPKPDSLKWPACVRALSLESLDSLEPLETNASCFRNCALQRAPVRWTLASKPTIWRSPGPCQSRNITEQRVETHVRDEQSFPRATRGTDHVTPETKDWSNTSNSHGKTKLKQQPA